MRFYLFLALLISTAIVSFAQHNELWNNLPVGQYKVGFRIITLIDKSRVDKPSLNYWGEPEKEDRHHKITIHLWYPAKSNKNGQSLKIRDYFFRDTLNTKNEEAEQRGFYQGNFGTLSDEEWESVAKTPMLAVKNAAYLKDEFPLLVGTLRVFSTAITNELLASHGYVVAMVCHSDAATYPTSYIAEIADMQQAIAYVLSKGIATEDKIGAFGFSGSGFAQVLLAMSDYRISGVADLESGLYAGGLWDGWLSKSNFYNVRNLRAPFLHFHSVSTIKEEKYFDEFEKKIFSDRYNVTLTQPIHHWDFATEGRISTTLFHKRGAIEASAKASFELSNFVLLHFFNYAIKGDQNSKKILSGNKLLNFNDSLFSIKNYPAIKRSPNRLEFQEMINRLGFDKAMEEGRDIIKNDRDAEFAQPNELNQLAEDYRTQQKMSEAKAVFTLAIELHPQEAWIWNKLAGMYEAEKDFGKALEFSSKVTEILSSVPDNEPSFNGRIKRSAKQRIERLTKK